MMTRAKKMVAAEKRGETLYERMMDSCVGYSDSQPTGRKVRMGGHEYDERLGMDGRLYRVRFDEDADEDECFREIRVDELPKPPKRSWL